MSTITTTPATKNDAIKAIGQLRDFIGRPQIEIVMTAFYGEEKQHFFDKMVELLAIVEATPQTYDSPGEGGEKIAHLHYFGRYGDWYIVEKDKGDENDQPGEGQSQAFGYANLGHGAELGYISIPELLDNGAELDFYFDPQPVKDIPKCKSGW